MRKETIYHQLRSKKILLFCTLFSLGLLMFACNTANKDKAKEVDPASIKVVGEMKAELTSPPNVPPTTANRKPTRLLVDMEILEKEGELMNGVSYTYWTFGGSVPGEFIRAKLGDEIVFTLKNHPDNKLPHNIDLHAVNGPGGGAVSSFVAPGHEITFTFKALHPGLYVYHCGTAPVGMHIGNGMYGLILIEPTEGLPPVDHEYYVMQGEFYTEGGYGERGHQAFDMQKAINEDPDYVVFNGKVNALTGKHALHAKVGDKIRLYVGNGGPSLISSFHVIGEIFDNVHVNGGSLINHNVQTQAIPVGSAAIIEFKVNAPGEYVMVDHSIFRAFNKGALGVLDVSGDKNELVYKGKIREGIYLPEGGAIQTMPKEDTVQKVEKVVELTKAEKIDLGGKLFKQTCAACHQPDGKGIPKAFPPLAGSDYLNADVMRAIGIVMNGKQGEVTVNGETFNSVMPSQNLTDQQISAVLTYVLSKWNNNGTEVTLDMVKKVREQQ